MKKVPLLNLLDPFSISTLPLFGGVRKAGTYHRPGLT